SHDFSDVPDGPTVILSATQVSGNCRVVGYIAPQEQFRLNLPVSGYDGRYLQQGCGGLCGEDYLGSVGSGAAGGASAASCPTVSAAVTVAAAPSGRPAEGTDNQGHVG